MGYGLDHPGPGLMLTRSMGDQIAHAAGCTHEPEVHSRDLTRDDSFLVIASDGVWDVLDNDSVCDTIHRRLRAVDSSGNDEEIEKAVHAACEDVLESALAGWAA